MNILWDFDGTICNTYPAYAKLLVETIHQRESYENVMKHLKVSFGYAFDYFQLTDQEISQFTKENLALQMEQMPPFPNIELVLRQADCNVIMTHKERQVVEKVLEFYHLDRYFAEIVTTENGFARKPNPASYQYLHDKYNLTLAIGDRELDLIPAKKVGFSTCMFQGNCASADFTIHDYIEFFDAWEQFKNQEKV
ncbi:HAD-IA family hydrolase [Rummeliibacillus sp. JY-2-4R]